MVFRFARSTVSKAWQDRILGLSAEAAFWQLLSVPPLMLAVLGVLGYAARWTGTDLVDRTEAHALRVTAGLVSPSVQHDVVTPIVGELLRHGRGGVATISIVLALWAGSSSTATFVNTVSIACCGAPWPAGCSRSGSTCSRWRPRWWRCRWWCWDRTSSWPGCRTAGTRPRRR
jgi:uncharacterized BrkB/YihY/UPF0761 family membrane protein